MSLYDTFWVYLLVIFIPTILVILYEIIIEEVYYSQINCWHRNTCCTYGLSGPICVRFKIKPTSLWWKRQIEKSDIKENFFVSLYEKHQYCRAGDKEPNAPKFVGNRSILVNIWWFENPNQLLFFGKKFQNIFGNCSTIIYYYW